MANVLKHIKLNMKSTLESGTILLIDKPRVYENYENQLSQTLQRIWCCKINHCWITVKEMRQIISVRIEERWNNPNLEKRSQWRKIPCDGEISTPDEWLRYTVEKLQVDGREDLLSWYPNL